MRILLLTTYFEPDSGAAAVRLSRLARILAQRGHEITVLAAMPHYPVGKITDAHKGRFATIEHRDGLRVIRTWLYATSSPRISRKLISQNTFMLTALLRGLRIPRPDVMLIEAQPVFTSFAGVILSRLKRVPYVLNVSDLWPDHLLSVGALTETSPIYRMARYMVDSTFRGASAITSLSPAWAEKIAGYIGTSDKISVIYNGVDLIRFRPGIDPAPFRQKYNLPDKKWVTFIGTYATQYDFDAMFEIAQRFASREDVGFAFIGSGSQSERIAGFDLPNVTRISWIPHDEIPQAWAASTLTYWAMRDHALYRGTIPAKLYEAIATGTPVAAAIQGAGAAMIEQSGGGLVVPCNDIDGLENAVSRLLGDDTLRQQHSESARAYAEANFDPQRVADAYEAVLQRVVR